MAKKFNPRRRTANQGVAFVQGIVDEMDCVWRPTPNDDAGLDGEIELGKEGVATARLIKVQVKSGQAAEHQPMQIRRGEPPRMEIAKMAADESVISQRRDNIQAGN
jgi:hypothetical protein